MGCSSLQALLLVLLTKACAYTTLETPDFIDEYQRGFFAAVVDVRTREEWEAGRIGNATFIESLQESGDVSSIAGCERCNIAVYCRTGRRSKAAAEVLEAAGFSSVYDALGVTQWEQAGMPLVMTPSRTPACHSSETCAWTSSAPHRTSQSLSAALISITTVILLLGGGSQAPAAQC